MVDEDLKKCLEDAAYMYNETVERFVKIEWWNVPSEILFMDATIATLANPRPSSLVTQILLQIQHEC